MQGDEHILSERIAPQSGDSLQSYVRHLQEQLSKVPLRYLRDAKIKREGGIETIYFIE